MLQPTAQTQELLELVNRIRRAPAAELDLLLNSGDPKIAQALQQFGVDRVRLAQQWSSLTAVAPVAWSAELTTSATGHNQQMIATDVQSHQIPGEKGIYDRAVAAGYVGTRIGENIFAYSESILFGHAGFAIDWGNDSNSIGGIQNPAGHRDLLLSNNYREVGIAITAEDNPNTSVGPLVITQDFGNRTALDRKAWLLGVAFQDLNGDSFYEAGEGVSGIDVEVRLASQPTSAPIIVTTLDAGGYQALLDPGQYQVSFLKNKQLISSQNVAVDANAPSNVKVDLKLADPTISIGSVLAVEGNAGNVFFNFAVNLSNPSLKLVTVNYGTVAQTATLDNDFLNTSGVLNFAPGETSKNIAVSVVGDLTIEEAETFAVNLSGAVNSSISVAQGIGTINNDDVAPPVVPPVVPPVIPPVTSSVPPVTPPVVPPVVSPVTPPVVPPVVPPVTPPVIPPVVPPVTPPVIPPVVPPVTPPVIPPVVPPVTPPVIPPVTSVVPTAVNPFPLFPQVESIASNLLKFTNSGSAFNLKFTPLQRLGAGSDDIGVFAVDDADGRIGTLLPGQAGYLTAALDRSQTIFSTLGGAFFDATASHQLTFQAGQRLRFFAVTDDTIDAAKATLAAGGTLKNLVLGDSGLLPITANGDKLNFAWNGTSSNLLLQAEISNQASETGTALQNKFELLDLRSKAGSVAAAFTVQSEASFKNKVGFYTVDDALTGRVGALLPGDAGYVQAAVGRAVATLDSVSGTVVTNTQNLAGGTILAPFIIANGADTYFAYIGANTDKVDHIKLLGDNRFGFEDMAGGGDRDFNDIVLGVKLS
jgi:uncharacterized protein YkwD